ncbi:flavodoxin FldA [Granulicella cerasi]|uniref:Flavodoxin n=1 Tax=Granulicella cerasi TaxID=741063 RepID=A0ABW1Z9G2_9BACT|nr:flavodoxin FldA [Granulicella cerasi]
MKVHIIYGTDNGNTRNIAEQIATQIGGKAVDVCSATTADFSDCDLLILGAPTSGYGDLQVDWECRLSFIAEAGLAGRKVALFGLGDQMSYCDTFVDALGVLYDAVVGQGATVIGATDKAGYDFYSSAALRDDKIVGLAIDEDNQHERTEARIAAWVASLQAEMGAAELAAAEAA